MNEWYISLSGSLPLPFSLKTPRHHFQCEILDFFGYFVTNLRFLVPCLQAVHQNIKISGMLKYWKSTRKHFLVWTVYLVLSASIVCGDKTRGVITKFLTRPVTLQPTSSTYNGHYESTWARVNLNWAAQLPALLQGVLLLPFLFVPPHFQYQNGKMPIIDTLHWCARWWNDFNIEHTLNALWTHSEHTLKICPIFDKISKTLLTLKHGSKRC